MAGGPQIYNFGNQNDWANALSLGVNAGTQIAGTVFNFQQLAMQKDAMMFDMMSSMVESLAPHMNMGARDAWKLFADSGGMGEIISKYMPGIDPTTFNQNFRDALYNEETLTPSDIVKRELSRTLQNPQPIGQQQQIPPSQVPPQQNVHQTGGTVPPPQDYSQLVEPTISPKAPTPPTSMPQQTTVPYSGKPEAQVQQTTTTETNAAMNFQNLINQTPVQGNPFEKKEQYREAFRQELLKQGYTEEQTRAIVAEVNNAGRFTENGVDLAGYTIPGKEPVTVTETTSRTEYIAPFQEIGQFEFVEGPNGVPEAALTLNQGRTLWDTVKDMTNSLITEEDKSKVFSETSGESSPLTYWMQSIVTDERNLEQLSIASGKSIDELKAMNVTRVEDSKRRNPLEELYSQYSSKLKLNIQFIPGSNTWRDVFRDLEMSPGQRDVIADLHEDMTELISADDIPAALDKQEVINDIIGEEQTFQNSISRSEWIFGITGGGDWIKGITPEDVNKGLQIAITEFIGGKELALQKVANEGRMQELLTSMQFKEVELAAMGIDPIDLAKLGIDQQYLALAYQDRKDELTKYYNEQTDKQFDEWSAEQEDAYARMVAIGDFSTEDKYIELYNNNPDFRAQVNTYLSIENAKRRASFPWETPEDYSKYLTENIPEDEANPDQWVQDKLNSAVSKGAFDPNIYMLTKDTMYGFFQWKQISAPALPGMEPPGNAPAGKLNRPSNFNTPLVGKTLDESWNLMSVAQQQKWIIDNPARPPTAEETNKQDLIRQQMGF